MFNLIPLEWRAGAVAAIAIAGFAGLTSAAWYLDHRGYQRATLEWTVKYNEREAELQQQAYAEGRRQSEANAAAKAAEEAELEVYRQKLVEMADLAQQLATEAAADKNAGNVALDADAVARHNRRLD